MGNGAVLLRGDHFPYTRNAVLLAMSTATLGRMSGGRPCWGLGPERKWDHPRQDGDAYGDPLKVMETVVAILRDLLTGEAATTTDGSSRLTNVRLAIMPSKLMPHIAWRPSAPRRCLWLAR